MADRWITKIPGVIHVPSSRRITLKRTGERVHTWHTFESKGYRLAALAGARYLISMGYESHFVFNPVRGELAQLLPMDTGARTLRAGSVVTNAHGTVHAQTEVIGDAANPWTADLTPDGIRVLNHLMAFLRSWDIPDVWVGGVRPPVYPGPGVKRFMPLRGVSGHTHHAAWLGNDHGDPGRMADPWSYRPRPAPVPAPPPALDPMGVYVVRNGDTLGAIAGRFRTSVDALVLLNGISNPDRIDVGDRLYTRWVVGAGDTLSVIAKATGTSVATLIRLNGITNPDRISVGQLIRLP